MPKKEPTPVEYRRQPTEASIDPTRLYRSDEAMLRMGWRPSGWRAARHAGLATHKSGKRYFVLGADLIAFVTEQRGEAIS
jgi:hypothetical protein